MLKKTTIIMAKVPRPGKVKTRLQTVLTPRDCAGLAESLLGDAIEKAARVSGRLVVAFSPDDGGDFFDRFSERTLVLTAQKGADLGEKMSNAFEFAFGPETDSAIVMIGTDSPTFPGEWIERAFEHLSGNAEAVLGRSEDGGFYLIGLRRLPEGIFANVSWSSPEAFRQTARNIENAGLRLSLLPKWYDVDLPDDLERLKKELKENPQLAPRTAQWLKDKVVSGKQ
ncbi:MAG: TIGR04282 family arsenosugar biosynthesis glycosyltransferase [Pyrinomonadaceae bacterium]